MSVLYHLANENVVVDALSRVSMSSIAYVKGERKELFKDVHKLARLGVRMVDFNKGGVLDQNGSESSPVVEMKAKHDMNSILVVLKKLICRKED